MKTLTLTNGITCVSKDFPAKESPMLHHKLGLQYTATGYGARIPTTQMIHYCGKWRRVYCAIFSNAGTCYIGKRSDNLIVS
jgi:hypothetical protein